MRVAKTKELIGIAVTAPLFSHMQNVGFLMTWLKCKSHFFFSLYTSI